MKKLGSYGYWIIWGAAAAAAAALYLFWNVNPDFMGIVETHTHKLGVYESGRVGQIHVALGDQVATKQLLVTLDASDLDAEEKWLKDELDRLEKMMENDRGRYRLEYEKLSLQREGDASRLAQRRSELEARKTELASVNKEVDRLQKIQDSGLGRPRDLSDLVIKRDALKRFIDEEGSALSRIGSIPRTGKTSNEDGVVQSMLGQRLDRISELRQALSLNGVRRDRRQVLSPCAGRVVKIYFMPGDSVERFLPIVTVEEPVAEFVDAYVPETSNRQPRLGEKVNVYSHRSSGIKAKGTVVFVDPGYSAIPDRLAFRNIIYWARKFRVKLDQGHQFMPGEAAKVEMLGSISAIKSAEAGEPPKAVGSAASAKPARAESVTLPIKVPEELGRMGSFEPSGIVWLGDIERYVIASDDTSRGKHEHAPWLYLMDRQGQVEPSPIRLKGVAQVNDLESIAQAPDGTLYMVSSQNISKKGKRPASRFQVLRVKRSGREFTVTGNVELLKVVLASFDKDAVRGLGLTETDADGLPVLNIEGSAWLNGDLLFGLKQPRPAKGASIWRLRDADAFFKTGTLSAGQLSVYGTADIRTPDGRPAGVSDLMIDPDGALFALSTVPKAGREEQIGGLHRLSLNKDGTFEVKTLASFPGVKPEGLCSTAEGAILVVLDKDDAPTTMQIIESPKP